MTTARDIIVKAMQKVGILFKTEQPSADEVNDGLDSLNAMLSSWSNDSLNCVARVLESFTLSAGVSSYSIGAGQTFDTQRPVFIVESHVRISTVDYPLTGVPDEVYQSDIPFKSQQGIPQFYNYSNAYPYGTIRLYPVPSTDYTLFILSEKEITQFSLDDTVNLPPGWEMALIYNLAMILAPEYGQQADPVTVQIAADSKSAIRRAIAKNRTMDAEPQLNPAGNIYNGWYT